MKKLSLFMFIIAFALFSCNKDNVNPDGGDDGGNGDDGNGNDEVPGFLWQYGSGIYPYSDMVLDESDNIYFVAETYLYSIDKDGKERWKYELSGMSNWEILYVDGNVIIGKNSVMCFDAGGNVKWELPLYTTSLAFSGNVLYVAGTDFYQGAIVTALDLAGNTLWSEVFANHSDVNISAKGDKVCLTTRDKTANEYKIGLKMLKNTGSTAEILWEEYFTETGDFAEPFRASFDMDGNVFFEEASNDVAYLHSFDAETGTEHWSTKLSDYQVGNPIILTADDFVVASYLDNPDDGDFNSIAFIEKSSGNIIASKDDVVSESRQVFLTADNSVLTFDFVDSKSVQSGPVVHVFSSTGEETKTLDGSIFGSLMGFATCKINSTHSFVFIDDHKLNCSTAEPVLTLSAASNWSSRNGNRFNTNSVQ